MPRHKGGRLNGSLNSTTKPAHIIVLTDRLSQETREIQASVRRSRALRKLRSLKGEGWIAQLLPRQAQHG
jgi:hypothetical protein